MEFFRRETHVDFMGKRRVAAVVSGILLVLSLVFILVRGLNFGLDFTGGTVIEVGYPAPVELDSVRGVLQEEGYGGAVVQHFGTSRDVLIRIRPQEAATAELSNEVLGALRAENADAELRRVEFVGPQVGENLREQGGLAMLGALFGVLVYVAFRFQSKFAVGSIAALVHDVLITVGFFAALQIEFDLTVLAALLAVIGYSLNDTIVVFDRIRENFVKVRKGTEAEIANSSINQTLSRTLMTSGTTLLVVIALYILGGELIAGFALALLVGIVVGTYSSIYVASALALALGVRREDLIPPPKEGEEEAEELP